MPEFDAIDGAILKDRMAQYDQRIGPRVGDWLLKLDGTWHRFTHDHGPKYGLQTVKGDGGSFYVGRDRMYSGDTYVSYSGGLDPCVPMDRLIGTTERKPGYVWIFHHDDARAGNAAQTSSDFRVFHEVPEAFTR